MNIGMDLLGSDFLSEKCLIVSVHILTESKISSHF